VKLTTSEFILNLIPLSPVIICLEVSRNSKPSCPTDFNLDHPFLLGRIDGVLLDVTEELYPDEDVDGDERDKVDLDG
jgi:hypothetical protein